MNHLPIGMDGIRGDVRFALGAAAVLWIAAAIALVANLCLIVTLTVRRRLPGWHIAAFALYVLLGAAVMSGQLLKISTETLITLAPFCLYGLPIIPILQSYVLVRRWRQSPPPLRGM